MLTRPPAVARSAALGAALSAAGALAAVALLVTGARELLRRQAAVARRVIGKPLGEQTPDADRTWKRSYGDPVELLVLGDSIAAGLGASHRKRTLGGQLARRLARRTHRAVRLRTVAQVGAETSMLRSQLADLPDSYRADVAVVVVGGNDVTHRVRTAASAAHLADAVRALRVAGTEVVVGTCPDLGALTAVPQPLRALGAVASRQLAAAQREAVLREGGYAVSLAHVVGPFFVAQPDRMFAEDRFHPSDDGYKRTAKALLPSVLAALGEEGRLPFGHHRGDRPPTPRAEAPAEASGSVTPSGSGLGRGRSGT